jgi:hypothetical protein
LLDQACAHCPIFPTAASRRSLGRVSVPVWLIILSDQLPIIALVGRYPTNQLIGRRLPPRHPLRGFQTGSPNPAPHAVLAAVSRGCPPSRDRSLRVTHPSATDRGRNPRPCDLHVLSMPPAFALSQDQTLRFIKAPPIPPQRRNPQSPNEQRPLAHRLLTPNPQSPGQRNRKASETHLPRYAANAPQPNQQASETFP